MVNFHAGEKKSPEQQIIFEQVTELGNVHKLC